MVETFKEFEIQAYDAAANMWYNTSYAAGTPIPYMLRLDEAREVLAKILANAEPGERFRIVSRIVTEWEEEAI